MGETTLFAGKDLNGAPLVGAPVYGAIPLHMHAWNFITRIPVTKTPVTKTTKTTV